MSKRFDPARTNTGPGEQGISLEAALCTVRDDSGRSLADHSDERRVLVVLLRHSGCSFCRETLARLAQHKARILSRGVTIAVVGMSESTAPLRSLGARFGLIDEIRWFADPGRIAYRALGLKRGGPLQLFGPRAIVGGFRAMLHRYGIGRPDGDPFQMPGAALIHRGRLLRIYRHRSVADRPDLEALACDVTPT